MVTSVLGKKVLISALRDGVPPVLLRSQNDGGIRFGSPRTQAFVSSDGLTAAWRSDVGPISIIPINGGAVRRFRSGDLWLAPGNNTFIASSGIWRAGPNDQRTHRVLTRAGHPLDDHLLFAKSPAEDSYGVCAQTISTRPSLDRAAVASVRPSSNVIRFATSRANFFVFSFSACAAADQGRSVATLASLSGKRGAQGYVFASVEGKLRTVKIPGLRNEKFVYVTFAPNSLELMIDDSDSSCLGHRVWLVDLANGSVRRLPGVSNLCEATVAPGGQTVLARLASRFVLIRTADGRGTTLHIPSPAGEGQYASLDDFHFSADGRRVFFRALFSNGFADLWSAASDGTDPVLLTTRDKWFATNRTFLEESADGSHAWTNATPTGSGGPGLFLLPITTLGSQPFEAPGQ